MSVPTRPDGQPVAKTTSNTFSLTSMVLALFGFLFSPLVLGVPAVLVAAYASRRGEPQSRRAMILSGVALVLGVILGLMIRAART